MRRNDFTVLRWAPDGRSLLFTGDSSAGSGAFRIDAESGEVSPIVIQPEGVWHALSVWAPDGEAIFYITFEQATDTLRIVRFDLTSEEETELYRGGDNISASLAISPDGAYLALVYPSTFPRRQPTTLGVIPTSGGELREVYRAPDEEHLVVGVLAWNPDGNLIFGTRPRAVRESLTELWSIRLDGGERRSLELAVEEPASLSIHPDGTFIALELHYEVDELWAIDNLLSELKTLVRR